MRRLAIIETYWYLAYQDGPVNNEKYSNEKDAKIALNNMRKGGRAKDVCVMSRTHEVEP